MNLSQRRSYIDPIVAALLAVLMLLAFGLYYYYSTRTVDWEKTKNVFDVFQKACTIVAIAFGGVWAYFNFFKGRVYRPSLEPKITGKFVSKDGVTYLITTATLKNVGLTDFKIQQEGTAIKISSYTNEKAPDEAESPEWKELGVFSVFKDHAWLEPKETIDDQRFIVIQDSNPTAVKIHLRVVHKGIEWNTWSVLEQFTSSKNQEAELLRTKEGAML